MTTLDENKIIELDQFIEKANQKENHRSELIGVLHKAQSLFGYLSPVVMNRIAFKMNIPTAHIWGVATFYHYFNLQPVGKNIISVCMGTACYVRGSEKILNTIKQELNINIGQTTPDQVFTLHEARCLGACGLAPVVMIGDKIYGRLDESKVVEIIGEYRKKEKVDG